ncbi:unnamed protein product [Closterium sp. NIES-65]|nr:unnamed protein product [Closterium sp. NIES-65]
MSQVDITRVMGQVQNTCAKLNARYVEYGVNFVEDSEHLTAFLEAHSHPSKRVVQVEGMDGDGNAVNHTFKLHGLDAKKKEDPTGDVESCVSLATLFAKEVIGRLQYRMRSLKSLVGSKLFLPDAYPDGVNKCDRLCTEWFSSLRKMFNAEQCALPAPPIPPTLSLSLAPYLPQPPHPFLLPIPSPFHRSSSLERAAPVSPVSSHNRNPSSRLVTRPPEPSLAFTLPTAAG